MAELTKIVAQIKGAKMQIEIMDYLNAFWVGGLICVIAQILIDKTKLTPARILVLFVTSGVLLTAIGLYEPLVKFAKAGATVPLTGFGYVMAQGIKEHIKAKGLFGVLTGGLSSSASGIAAAIFFGYIFSVFFKSGDKQ